ncbi:alpha/beta-hydrolase [Aspergillus phoenicis ATCC 13157]|uniref:Alpha/beta-hydrolase n=1 Tax=Aspergillus phoenicis ATCC 13157 TaxID=1353007 RepID=A0A370PIZ3_ASPPH|nr:alpha/beta-hydrolase [Aspergillus phoenicis ATCC 13157]
MASFTAWLFRMFVTYIRRSRLVFGSAENMRNNMRELYLRPRNFNPPKNLEPGITIDRIDYGAWPLYRVSSAGNSVKKRPAMMYIHGGAFYREINPQHWKLVAQAVRDTGLDAIVPIYPLLPRPGTTAAEVIDGFMDICSRLEQPIVSIVGDSAGGMYTLATMQQLLKQHPELARRVLCIVLISPILDLGLDHPEVVRRAKNDPWLGLDGLRQLLPLLGPGLPAQDPIVSPLFGDIETLPPLMLLSGTYDMLVADAQRLSAKFQGKGTEICMPGSFKNDKFTFIEQPEMVHVYPLLPHPEGAEARETIIHFLKQHIGKASVDNYH